MSVVTVQSKENRENGSVREILFTYGPGVSRGQFWDQRG